MKYETNFTYLFIIILFFGLLTNSTKSNIFVKNIG